MSIGLKYAEELEELYCEEHELSDQIDSLELFKVMTPVEQGSVIKGIADQLAEVRARLKQLDAL